MSYPVRSPVTGSNSWITIFPKGPPDLSDLSKDRRIDWPGHAATAILIESSVRIGSLVPGAAKLTGRPGGVSLMWGLNQIDQFLNDRMY